MAKFRDTDAPNAVCYCVGIKPSRRVKGTRMAKHKRHTRKRALKYKGGR